MERVEGLVNLKVLPQIKSILGIQSDEEILFLHETITPAAEGSFKSFILPFYFLVLTPASIITVAFDKKGNTHKVELSPSNVARIEMDKGFISNDVNILSDKNELISLKFAVNVPRDVLQWFVGTVNDIRDVSDTRGYTHSHTSHISAMSKGYVIGTIILSLITGSIFGPIVGTVIFILAVLGGSTEGAKSNSNKSSAPAKGRNKGTFKRLNSALEKLDLHDEAVVVDTETTGLGKEDQVIEIAVVDLQGRLLLDTLVKPTVAITKEAQIVHGLTPRKLRKAPTWQEVVQQYRKVTDGRTVLSYNSAFDSRLIRQSCKANGVPAPRRKYRCIMEAYAEYIGERGKYGDYRWWKLEQAAKHFGSKYKGPAHRAKSDCYTAAGVLGSMVEKWRELDPG